VFDLFKKMAGRKFIIKERNNLIFEKVTIRASSLSISSQEENMFIPFNLGFLFL